MILSTQTKISTYNDAWRRQKSRAFDLFGNSTAKSTITFPLWGNPVTVYANANLSIYSAQRCNASCRFCVEELRPASRGSSLQIQKKTNVDDSDYFARLEQSLVAMTPLAPSLSITGGEPSKDARLPRILQCVRQAPAKRRTLTTNASGLMDIHGRRRLLEHVADACLNHLNISIADPDIRANGIQMGLRDGLTPVQLSDVVSTVASAGTRVRFSCVLLKSGVQTIDNVIAYLEFARSMGVDNVIFRQLMKSDPATHSSNSIVTFSDQQRVLLEPLLDQISRHPEFAFEKQIVGYYYYVEVWRYQEMDVVFEEADLADLERVKRQQPHIIHELIFHPNGQLASTWQPWDGVLGP